MILAEALEELQEAPESSVAFWPWKKEEEIIALLAEEGSGTEAGKESQKLSLQQIPMKLNPSTTTQATKCSLPVAPSTDQVYILPTPRTQSTPKTPTTKAPSIALPVLQKFKKLVATVQASATTSKTQVDAYIAWHSEWFGCRFGFGAPEPRHFKAPPPPPPPSPIFCVNFSYFVLFYHIFYFINFSSYIFSNF